MAKYCFKLWDLIYSNLNQKTKTTYLKVKKSINLELLFIKY